MGKFALTFPPMLFADLAGRGVRGGFVGSGFGVGLGKLENLAGCLLTGTAYATETVLMNPRA